MTPPRPTRCGRHDTLWNPRPLDLAAMNEAASRLLGEHDFAAFCRRREGATTVRALRRLDWQRDADGVAVGCVIADAFCHNMVRALVGALIPVGEGGRPPSWPSEVLTAAVRHPGVQVVPRTASAWKRSATRSRANWPPAPPSPAASAPQATDRADQRSRGAAGRYAVAPGLGASPVTMRWLRLVLTVPATRSPLACSSWLSSAVVDGAVPLTNSNQVRIR